MLDQQHGQAVPPNSLDQAHEPHRLDRVESRGGLVQQQHRRRRRQRDGQPQQPLLAAREHSRELAFLVTQPHEGQHVPRALDLAALLEAIRAAHAQHARQPGARQPVAGGQHIVERGGVGKDARTLEHAHEATLRDAVGRLSRDVGRCETHAPGVRRLEARDDVEGRGLAGAVRADQRQDLASPQLEAQVVHGGQPTEAHRDMRH